MTRKLFRLALGLVLMAGVCGRLMAADRVTILYDAFSDSKELTKDWGFSALVEHDGKQILFDSGNNAEIFEHNVKALRVDLTKIDFAVISHRHSDHATGVKYLLKVNPAVTIYVPADGANGFGGMPVPAAFFRPDTDLPGKMRYFGGTAPEHLNSGKPYDTGKIVFGGLHLVTTPVEEIDTLVGNLQTKWKVQRIAPGHCTGEPAFAGLRKAYGEKYVYAGLGTVVVME